MTTKYSWGWIVFGIGALLVFMLASLPAATLYRYFRPGGIRLMGIDGTIWSGHAALGSASGLPLHDIRWQLSGFSLLSGHASAHLQARLSEGFIDTDIKIFPNGTVVLSDLKLSTTLPALRFVAPIKGLHGQVSLDFERVRLTDGWPTAAIGELRIAELATPPVIGQAAEDPAPIPLGNYQAEFKSTEDSGLAATFSDTGHGPLQVSGKLSLNAKHQYRIQASIAARADAPQTLRQRLKYLPGKPGHRHILLSGGL